MPRPSNFDVRNAFEEIPCASTDEKCQRVKCKHCHTIRAKNTTRQILHLKFRCEEFKNSDDYKNSSLIDLDLDANYSDHAPTPPPPAAKTQAPSAIWTGKQPNPDLQVVPKKTSTKRNRNGTAKEQPQVPTLVTPTVQPSVTPVIAAQAPQIVPSLTQGLERLSAPLSTICQQPFLCNVGAGTLDPDVLNQWTAQRALFSRAYITFVGSLLAKVRIPVVPNVQAHAAYRTVITLQAVLSNILGVINILENNLPLSSDPPKPATKAYMDLLHANSAPNASLLEGLVVLWVTEHCNLASWRHAVSYRQSYALYNTVAPHIAVIHQHLMPAWTGDAFVAIVDTCRRLVDEYANSSTSGNGRDELNRCEASYKQVVWLWTQMWPDRPRSNTSRDLTQRPEELGDHAMPNGTRPLNMHGNGTQDMDAEAEGDANNDMNRSNRNSIAGQSHMAYMSPFNVGSTGPPMNIPR